METTMTTTVFVSPNATQETDWKFTDPTQRKLVGGMLTVIGLAGLVGNAVVIFAFMLSKRLQNITNVFVINLAVSDFLSSMLVPFFVQNVLTEKEELLPKPLCAMVGTLLYVFVSSSIVNHAVIAFNRYYSISRPDAVYRKTFSPRRMVLMLVLIWGYSSIIPLVTQLSGYTEFGHNSKYRICSLDINQRNARLVSFVRAVAVDVVCLIVIIIFYLKFFLFIKRHSVQLMHIYSTERKGSEPSSDISSIAKRGSDASSHANGMTRQSSTVTRVVDIDEGGVETVINGSSHRPILWRPVGRSVSQTVMTPVLEAFNGYVEEDIIREEDELRIEEEASDHNNHGGHIEEEAKSESPAENPDSEKISAIIETPLENVDLPGPESPEVSRDPAEPSKVENETIGCSNGLNNEQEQCRCTNECREEKEGKTEIVSRGNVNHGSVEKLSAIIETPQENVDLPRQKNLAIVRDSAEPSTSGTETNQCLNGVNIEAERCRSTTKGPEEKESSESSGKTCNVSSNNVNRDSIEHSSSTEDSVTEHESNEDEDASHNSNNATLPTVANGTRYRQERTSPSGSPTHSAIANQRRRISELVQRSFFGRGSSVNSHSERIRCMQVRLNRRQVQITKNLFVVVCAFLVCVSQYAVFLIVPQFEQILPYSAVLLTVSHAINPFIYAIKHPTFKVVIWPMLMCKLSKIPRPSKLLKAILRK